MLSSFRLAERMADLEGWFILASGWQRVVAAFLAGVFSALAMAPFDLVFVLFFTIPVLIWLMDGATSEPSAGIISRLSQGFSPGYFFGFGYFVAGLWWLSSALLVDGDAFAWAIPLAVIALPALLALFWGAATALAGLFWNGSASRVIMLAACLGLFEFLRGFVATGFPWNTLGYAAFFNPLTMQTASVIGLYAATPLVVLIAALPLFAFPTSDRKSRIDTFMVIICVALVFGHLAYGALRLQQNTQSYVDGVTVRIVQPAVRQADKFDPTKEAENFKRFLDLSVSELDGKMLSDATHLVWPESAFPFLLTQRRDALASIAAMLPEGTSLITGAARLEEVSGANERDLVFNSVYVVDHEGIIAAAADKVHLVPFGEYLPFQEVAEAMGLQKITQSEGGFSAGNARKLLSTGVGPAFLPLICYEIIFSGNIWDGKKRPAWIVNLTNDAWFDFTPGPYQHERQAVVRAVEEGLPLVRVANTGISGVYDAYGNPLVRLPNGLMAAADSPLPNPAPVTIFSVYRNIVFWTIFVAFLMIGIIPAKRS